MGDIPLMTMNGTFVVNGHRAASSFRRCQSFAWRVLRSRQGQKPIRPASCCSQRARHFPYRGSWLDIEFDAKDIVFARIGPPPQDFR